MLKNSMGHAERLIGKFFALLVGLIFCCMLLLMGIGFFGFSLYLLFQNWLSPAHSAFMTGVVFMVTVVVAAVAIRVSLASKPRHADTTISGVTAQPNYRTVVKEHPATCLSLAVVAGYLYESQPQLKAQVGKTLGDLVEVYTVELTKKNRS